MFSFLQRFKELLIIGALLLGPLISYLSSGHRGREPNFIDRSVRFISTPLQTALTWTIDGAMALASGYVGLRGAHDEARQCRAGLAQAHSELNALKEAEAENRRLKSMLHYVEETADQEIVARVVGLNPSPQFQSIHINRGEDDGVQVGMPVVTPDGAVGQVVRSMRGSADVMLLNDPSSRIGALIQRTRVRATVAGTGDGHRLSIDLVRREDDMRPGDVLVTAGSDGIFPSGIKIGVVESAERPTVGMFYRATLEPSVELNRVEEVLVIPVTKVVSSAKGGLP